MPRLRRAASIAVATAVPGPLVQSRAAWLAAAVVTVFLVLQAAAVRAQVVFQTDFGSGIPAELAGQGVQLEGVQGCAGLGAPGNQFAGSLLRYYAQQLHDTTLTLTGLPAHTHVSLGCLLALIDSWDGTELFQVEVDGQLLFSHWFQLATGDDSDYVPPPGGLLSSGHELGWSLGSWYARDRAYDLSLEPAFIDIPHTAGTLTVVFRLGAVSGGAAANWQGGTDESWAIDNLKVTVSGGASPAPLPTVGAALLGNTPNPFNPSTRILFTLPAGGADVELSLYDLSGRRVRRLTAGFLAEGLHEVTWDGRADDGRLAPGGVYVYRLAGAGIDLGRRLVLLK